MTAETPISLLVDSLLCIKPLELILASKNGPVNPVAILFDNLLGVYAVQAVLALICAAAVCTILRRSEDTYMYVTIIYSWESDLAEEMQSVGRDRNADRLEVMGGERGQFGVRDPFDGAEVLGLVS